MNINSSILPEWMIENHLVAFDALPEEYQDHDTLVFFWEKGKLKARPSPRKEKTLGTWTMVYSPVSEAWTRI